MGMSSTSENKIISLHRRRTHASALPSLAPAVQVCSNEGWAGGGWHQCCRWVFSAWVPGDKPCRACLQGDWAAVAVAVAGNKIVAAVAAVVDMFAAAAAAAAGVLAARRWGPALGPACASLRFAFAAQNRCLCAFRHVLFPQRQPRLCPASAPDPDPDPDLDPDLDPDPDLEDGRWQQPCGN